MINSIFGEKDKEVSALENILKKRKISYLKPKNERCFISQYQGKNSTYEVVLSVTNKNVVISVTYPFVVRVEQTNLITELCLRVNNENPHCPSFFDYSTLTVKFQTSVFYLKKQLSEGILAISLDEAFRVADQMYSAFMMVQFGNATPIAALEATRQINIVARRTEE